jgi:hypothetical protein
MGMVRAYFSDKVLMGPKCLTCAGSASCYAPMVLETACAAMLSGLAGSGREPHFHWSQHGVRGPR